MTMITAPRLNFSQPVRFGTSNPAGIVFADSVIAQMGEVTSTQRQTIYQFLQALSVRTSCPSQLKSGPALCAIQGPRKLDFVNALLVQQKERPIVYLDADRISPTPIDSSMSELFVTGYRGQPSVKSLIEQGKHPIIVIKNINELSDKATNELLELHDRGTIESTGQAAPLSLAGLEILCTTPSFNLLDSPLQNRVALKLDI